MLRLPYWLRSNKCLPDLRDVKLRLRKGRLSTVCEEARCPNISECFSHNDATFLILGDVCTRGCAFCSIRKGNPSPPDRSEPQNLALTAAELLLKHVVITSVTRDDLEDGGAGHFASCINEVRKRLPLASIEVLVPDFFGREESIKAVLDEEPHVFAHNVETVGRLYPLARYGSRLDRSLNILSSAKIHGKAFVKTGMMVGLGESDEEISVLIRQVADAGADILTIGQYLQPSKRQIEVIKYYNPDAFQEWAELAKESGIRYVVSGPLIRSSYMAGHTLSEIQKARKPLAGGMNAICKD